jgi:hypothetical protein
MQYGLEGDCKKTFIGNKNPVFGEKREKKWGMGVWGIGTLYPIKNRQKIWFVYFFFVSLYT